MNKRNTVLATIFLVVLVLFLIGRGIFRHSRTTTFKITTTTWLDSLTDTNMPTDFDTATVEALDWPIIIHYTKPMNINGSRAMLHVVGLSADVLNGLKKLKDGSVMPDSTQSIHIYPKFLRSMTSSVNLGVYRKTSMKEDVQYTVTYPVKDSSGLHVMEDSGMVSTEINWKSYGVGAKAKDRRASESAMTKQLEHLLIKDVAKKMEESKN